MWLDTPVSTYFQKCNENPKYYPLSTYTEHILYLVLEWKKVLYEFKKPLKFLFIVVKKH